MKYFFVSLLIILTVQLKAQENNCYSIVIRGASICNSTYKWNAIKVTASKDKLLNFLRTNKLLHSCNYLLTPEVDILKEFTKAECPSELIKIEFQEPKDVLQLYKELKGKKQSSKADNLNDDKPNGGKGTESITKENIVKEPGNEEPPSVEICISSNDEISLSFSNEQGSFQVTSKGKFSVSAKGENDTEYKVGL
jgi:hypothetical protein